ncbi:hypothetical protein DL98DRAFT_529882 [Cadophora sp. DSE1049]|nr:hypothetical protein DL98DRAFT_529882 [Cadophora sp. DSE1049]
MTSTQQASQSIPLGSPALETASWGFNDLTELSCIYSVWTSVRRLLLRIILDNVERDIQTIIRIHAPEIAARNAFNAPGMCQCYRDGFGLPVLQLLCNETPEIISFPESIAISYPYDPVALDTHLQRATRLIASPFQLRNAVTAWQRITRTRRSTSRSRAKPNTSTIDRKQDVFRDSIDEDPGGILDISHATCVRHSSTDHPGFLARPYVGQMPQRSLAGMFAKSRRGEDGRQVVKRHAFFLTYKASKRKQGDFICPLVMTSDKASACSRATASSLAKVQGHKNHARLLASVQVRFLPREMCTRYFLISQHFDPVPVFCAAGL